MTRPGTMRAALIVLATATLLVGVLGTPAEADRAGVPKQILDVSNLPTGEPPALVWSERTKSGTTIHGPAGDTPVDGQVVAVAPMGSGYVVQGSDPKRPGGLPLTRWVGADGVPGHSTWHTGYGLGVSDLGRVVAFTVRRGGVRVIDEEGDRVLAMSSVPSKEVAAPALVSGEYCKEDATSNGCSVIVNSTRRSTSWYVTSHGIVDSTGFKQVSAGRGRWTGGITEITDTGTCSEMRKRQRARWSTCRHRFSDISPSKRHVLGLPAYGDGFGPMDLTLISMREGTSVRQWTSSRAGDSATYFDEVWEDSQHVLVVTYQDRKWAVVRLGLDGSMEYAVAPRRGSDLRMRFHLQTR